MQGKSEKNAPPDRVTGRGRGRVIGAPGNRGTRKGNGKEEGKSYQGAASASAQLLSRYDVEQDALIWRSYGPN
jgi:hypothetical protein